MGTNNIFFRLGLYLAARSCFCSVSGSRPISGRAAFESRKPKRGFTRGDMLARRVGGADASERQNGFGRAVKHLRHCTRAAQLHLSFVAATWPPYYRNTLLPYNRNTPFAAASPRPSSCMQPDITIDAGEPRVTPSCPAKTAGEKRTCAHSNRRFKRAKRRELAAGCGAVRSWRSTREW